MFGWLSAEIVFASRSNRSRKSRIVRYQRWEDLDRHCAFEASVHRLVDLAHAAGTNRAEDLVRAEPRACHQRHRRNYSPEYTWIGEAARGARDVFRDRGAVSEANERGGIQRTPPIGTVNLRVEGSIPSRLTTISLVQSTVSGEICGHCAPRNRTARHGGLSRPGLDVSFAPQTVGRRLRAAYRPASPADAAIPGVVYEEGSKLRSFAKPCQQWIGLEQRVARKPVGGGLLDPILRACEVSELCVDSTNRIFGVMKMDEPPSTRDRLVNVRQRASAVAPLHAQHGARRMDDAALIAGARGERGFISFEASSSRPRAISDQPAGTSTASGRTRAELGVRRRLPLRTAAGTPGSVRS